MADVTPRQACISEAVDEVLADIPPRQLVERAASAARAEIVAWLEAQAANYEDAYNRDPEDPRARAFAVLNEAAMDIASGAPQRWAAEREEQGRG